MLFGWDSTIKDKRKNVETREGPPLLSLKLIEWWGGDIIQFIFRDIYNIPQNQPIRLSSRRPNQNYQELE